MYVSYGIIGAVLVLFGLASCLYFIKLFKQLENDQRNWYFFFESLITVVIGLCYVYCCVVLALHSVAKETQDEIDDDFAIILNNTDFLIEVSSTTTTKTSLMQDEDEIKENTEVEEYKKRFQEILKLKKNKTIFYNNKKYRSLEASPPSCDLSWTFFIEQALFLYSFVHCVLSLINNSILCKNCDEKTQSRIFKAFKNEKTQLNVLQVVLTISLPIIAVLVLYLLLVQSEEVLEEEPLEVLNNFNTTIDLESLKRLSSTKNNQQEMSQIISKVYQIVDKAKNVHTAPPKINAKFAVNCKILEPKMYYFFVYTIAYFASLFYAKINEISSGKSPNLRRQIVSTGLLWMPTIFLQNFRQETTGFPAIFQDFLLGMGNFNRLLALFYSYLHTKSRNFVQPA